MPGAAQGVGGGTTLEAVDTADCTVLGALVTVFCAVETSDCTGPPEPPPDAPEPPPELVGCEPGLVVAAGAGALVVVAGAGGLGAGLGARVGAGALLRTDVGAEGADVGGVGEPACEEPALVPAETDRAGDDGVVLLARATATAGSASRRAAPARCREVAVARGACATATA